MIGLTISEEFCDPSLHQQTYITETENTSRQLSEPFTTQDVKLMLVTTSLQRSSDIPSTTSRRNRNRTTVDFHSTSTHNWYLNGKWSNICFKSHFKSFQWDHSSSCQWDTTLCNGRQAVSTYRPYDQTCYGPVQPQCTCTQPWYG